LGIPGNGTSALFLGALMVHGLAPGTQLFTRTPDTVYGMFLGLIVANFAILAIGLFGAPVYSKITKVPLSILIPIIGSLCVLGAYTFRNLYFDTVLVIVFGLIGYYMSRANFPLAPFVLTFVLGRSSEMAFRRTLIITGGDFASVMFKPLALSLLAIDFALLIWPFWGDIVNFFKKNKQNGVTEH
jgi:putative tricarboxylic transport membrane protein